MQTLSRYSNKQIHSLYGGYKCTPQHRGLACAMGRILIYRHPQHLPPKGWEGLLSIMYDLECQGYTNRYQFCGLFDITYNEYLRTEIWSAIRWAVLVRDNRGCRGCPALATQVHHQSYDVGTLCGVSLNRLFSLCDNCHETIEFNGTVKRPFDEMMAITEEVCGTNGPSKAKPPSNRQPRYRKQGNSCY